MLKRVAQNHTNAGLIRDVPYGLNAMRLDGPDDVVFVIWIENAEMQPQIRVSGDELSVTNLFGELIGKQDSQITLQATERPIYVRLKRE